MYIYIRVCGERFQVTGFGRLRHDRLSAADGADAGGDKNDKRWPRGEMTISKQNGVEGADGFGASRFRRGSVSQCTVVCGRAAPKLRAPCEKA